MITLDLWRESVVKLHINARLINSKCHPALWITYYRNVGKRLRMWQRLISLAYFEEPSSAVFLSFFKHSLHFSILKGALQSFFLHVFYAQSNNQCMMWGRLAALVIPTAVTVKLQAAEGKSWGGVQSKSACQQQSNAALPSWNTWVWCVVRARAISSLLVVNINANEMLWCM